MVTFFAKSLLENTRLDPFKVSKFTGVPEQECWEYLEDYNRAINTAERAHNALEMRKELHEWIDTIPDLKSLKTAILRERLEDAKKHPEKYDIKRLLIEKDVLLGKVVGVTVDEIYRAKDYPITQLLNVTRRGNISCPLHDDKNPSFQIKKNNKFTCYSCGEYGDVLDLYQKLHKATFVEAVRALS